MNRDSLDFSCEPVALLFRKMFLPTLVGMISMVVLNVTDGAFVGHCVGSDALAAVNIVAPLFLLTGGMGLMYGIGSSVVASIHLAKKNKHAADINVTQGLLASFVTGIIVATIVLSFQDATCRLFGCSDLLLPLAKEYLFWIAVLLPFNMVGATGMFALRLDGSPRYAMGINCGIAGLNIFLDYLFIVPLDMGLKGAAIATSISFSSGVIPMAIYMLRYSRTVNLYRIKMSWTSLRLTLRNVGYQMRIGVSALLGDVAIASVIIVGNYVFLEYLGEDGVAAYSVACYCLPITFMVGNAIVQSVQPIVSFAHGVNNKGRMVASLSIALRTALAMGFMGMVVIAIGSGLLAGVFLPVDCRAHDLCAEGMPYFSPAFLIVAINIVLIGYLQSQEKDVAATTATIFRGFVCSVPAFILMPKLVGEVGLWLALPIAELIALIFIGAYVLKNR